MFFIDMIEVCLHFFYGCTFVPLIFLRACLKIYNFVQIKFLILIQISLLRFYFMHFSLSA